MILRRSGFLWGSLAVAALAWGALCPAKAEDRLPERPVAPKSAVTQTNTSRLVRPKNGLLRLEEQVSHAFQFLKPSPPPEDLSAGMPPRPVVAPVQTRRSRELQDERKDWMLLNPSELTSAPKLEDLLNVPDYNSGLQNKKSFSSIERFYEDIDRRGSAKSNKGNRKGFSTQDPRDSLNASRDQNSDDPNLPSGIRDTESSIRKLLGLSSTSSSSGSTSSRGGFSDIFGSGDNSTPSEEDLKRKAYLKEYNDWLNRSATPPSSGFASVPGVMDAYRPGANATLPGMQNAYNPLNRPANYDPNIGAANPTLMVSTPQDITAKVLNQWNPLYSAPKVEPPKYEPPKPIFDVPRRKF